MQLVRYDPLRELKKMEGDFDKLWENGWGFLPSTFDTSTMDLYEEKGKLIAVVNLPNFKKDEVTVTNDDGVIQISAEHKEDKETSNNRRYYFREISNQYMRRVKLPENVKPDKVEAEFKNGILKISMPLATQPKVEAKTVPIK
jgi:HSP20 family protein